MSRRQTVRGRMVPAIGRDGAVAIPFAASVPETPKARDREEARRIMAVSHGGGER